MTDPSEKTSFHPDMTTDPWGNPVTDPSKQVKRWWPDEDGVMQRGWFEHIGTYVLASDYDRVCVERDEAKQAVHAFREASKVLISLGAWDAFWAAYESSPPSSEAPRG